MNNNLQGQKIHNQTLDCIKLLCALFVVIIHIPFPGEMGGMVGCVGRFCVPVFFAISGYFSFGTDSRKLLQRMLGIVKLELLATCVQLLSSLGLYLYNGVSLHIFYYAHLLSPQQIAQWVVLNINPYGGHLWYLPASAMCYGMLWLYVTFFGKEKVDYRMLYLFSFAMLGVHFALDEFALGLGMAVPYQLTRNALLFGLPMFSLGLFLREYGEQILENYRLTGKKLLVLLGIGGILCLIEFRGIGYCEMYIGSILMTAVWILLASRYPVVWKNPGAISRLIRWFGGLSLWIYLLHLAVNEWYMNMLQQKLDVLAQGREDWLRPILTVILTVLAAGIAERIQYGCKMLWKKAAAKK